MITNNNILLKELNENFIDYNKIRDESIFVLYANEEQYDVSFIVPVRGRLNFSKPMYDNFVLAREQSRLNISYTIVEHSESPEHSKFCKKNRINYIWIKSYSNEQFNKCLALNFGALFSIKKCDFFLFHDIDCLIQTNFFINLQKNIENKNCKSIQCFHGRRVLYLDQELTNKIISNEIHVDSLKLGIPGITLPMYIGAPGGSIMINRDLFFRVGGYDPEFFRANSPEDIFFWDKVAFIDRMEISDNPEIDIFHMHHTPTYYDNPFIDHMKKIYEIFKNSSDDDKLHLINKKSKLIQEFK